MEVILKTNVDGLGRVGELVKVADGYARNYLIPKGLAMLATEKSRRILEHQQRLEAMRQTKERRQAEQLVEQLANVTCTVRRLAGENDRLFGSVTAMDIAESLAQQGFEIDRRKIDLEEPIKELGTHVVPIKLVADIVANVRVEVLREESS